MSSGTWDIAWGQVLVTALLTVIGALVVNHYTSQVPELVYQQFPPAHFTSQAAEVSIYNVALENIGSKEATDVRLFLALPIETTIREVQVEPSSTAIDYQVVVLAAPNTKQIQFPLLNAGEGARVSLLVNSGSDASMVVEVRGKGVVGRSRSDNRDSPFRWLLNMFVGLFVASLVMLLISNTRTSKIIDYFRKSSSEQLRTIRTQVESKQREGEGASSLSRDALDTIVTQHTWKLVFRPVDGRAKIMRFGAGGKVLEGGNKNEYEWRIRNDNLELMNSEGRVHNRFYFSSVDGRFYSTNDPDVGAMLKHSILDQYLIPESFTTKAG